MIRLRDVCGAHDVPMPVYHLLTLRFAIPAMHERMDQSSERGSSSSNARGSMMIKTAIQTMQIWRAALAMRPGHLIDEFLDWIEETSSAMVSARVHELALIEARTDRRRDH